MDRVSKLRSRVLLVLFGLLLCFFSMELYRLQVVEQSTDNQTTFTTMTRVKAARGEIHDRNGNVLVGNRASYDVVINHYVLTSTDNTNDHILALVKLCRELGIEYIDHFPMTYEAPFTYTLENYTNAWQGYFRNYLQSRGSLDSDIAASLLLQKLRASYGIPEDWSDEDARLVLGVRYELTLRNQTNLSTYIFVTDATNEERAAILELNTPGLKVEASMVREYYTPYAAHILGYIGAMSPEQWEEYKDIDGYQMDAEVGQSGFELAFEPYLHGIDGWRIDTVAADGTLLSSKFDPEPKAGNNVEVTIDIDLQMMAEDALDRRLSELRNQLNDTEGGAVVMMDIDSGEILACASYPTYDPAMLFKNYGEITQQPYGPLNNRALQFAYPPGSVYKMSMVAAGIDNNLITPITEIEDKGVFTKYSGFSPSCLLWSHSGGKETHGEINAEWALCVSCNYFFYELADNMGLSIMDATAKGFGLGEPTGVELPENIGYRANLETKKILYEGDESHWLQGDMIQAAIGQSDNQFTPLQLCVYTCTLANQGVRYKATFLNRVVSTDYRSLIFENTPKIMSEMYVSDEARETYVTGMRKVCYEHVGTASETFISYPVDVAAKTGTAQTGDTGKEDNGAFVCFAPGKGTPEVAIAVYGERAGSGGNLAPIARDVLDVYFAMDDERSAETYENQIT